MEHLNRLQAFRQAVYDQVLTKRRDAQQELLDALLLSPPMHAFPELSPLPELAYLEEGLARILAQAGVWRCVSTRPRGTHCRERST